VSLRLRDDVVVPDLFSSEVRGRGSDTVPPSAAGAGQERSKDGPCGRRVCGRRVVRWPAGPRRLPYQSPAATGLRVGARTHRSFATTSTAHPTPASRQGSSKCRCPSPSLPRTRAPPETEHAPELRLHAGFGSCLVVGATFVLCSSSGLPSGAWRAGPRAAPRDALGAAPGAAVIGSPVAFVLTIAARRLDGPRVIRPAEQLASFAPGSRHALRVLPAVARSRTRSPAREPSRLPGGVREPARTRRPATGWSWPFSSSTWTTSRRQRLAGHAVGDDSPRGDGPDPASQLRASDRPFRIGGTSSRSCLPHTDAENAKARREPAARRVRRAAGAGEFRAASPSRVA